MFCTVAMIFAFHHWLYSEDKISLAMALVNAMILGSLIFIDFWDVLK